MQLMLRRSVCVWYQVLRAASRRKARPGAPISIIVNYYSLAKEHALSERKPPSFRQFCRFYDQASAEAESTPE
jgi:hypothetical protein